MLKSFMTRCVILEVKFKRNGGQYENLFRNNKKYNDAKIKIFSRSF